MRQDRERIGFGIDSVRADDDLYSLANVVSENLGEDAVGEAEFKP